MDDLRALIADVDGRFWEKHPELTNRRIESGERTKELREEWNSLLRDRALQLVAGVRDQVDSARAISLGE
ncbi:hypothetical protein Acsp06_62640 [Actinomycetospora sp. NBRC 106375]|uniref:hypothetical protein n=1 Tax=Actinomycetospora sp. NBRC 106375 TaxID=3032207 RepID=UPI0024A0AF8B|nr:hypothetical protein [Actinomycetospora sp. NBRC 106375]GLZ50079.1 hypothetical protein Acsp06_62640 [Actinomycetospora sp. NBRC 106375]